MCKAMQLYGLSAKEALKLSDAQVNLLLDHAENAAASVIASPEFSRTLRSRLEPVGRSLRADFGSDEDK